MKVRGTIALTLFLAFCLAGLAPSQARQLDLSETIRRHPMVFFVANGPEGSCGLGCSQWIAADGAFDSGANLRFREFLDKLARTDLPVYFNSPGGIAGQAISIGLTLRDRRMMAGVGRTVPLGCAVTPRPDEACRRKMQSGEEFKSRMQLGGAICASSCVLALIGAPTRKIAPLTRIGIHAHRWLNNDETKVLTTLGNIRDPQVLRLAFKLYAVQMGADYRFIDVAENTPARTMHWMTQEELTRFNIATAGPFETKWLIHTKSNIGYYVMKTVTRPDTSLVGAFETVTLEFSCPLRGSMASLTLRRVLNPAEAKGETSVRVVADGSTIFEDGRKWRPGFDIRSGWLRAGDILKLATADGIVMSESSDTGTRQTRFSTEGLRAAFALAPDACRPALP